jgi:hypothetical protein
MYIQTNKSTTATYRKENKSWQSGIYPRTARLV